MDQPNAVDQPGIYRIKIQGRLSEGTIRRFDEMVVLVEPNAAGVSINTNLDWSDCRMSGCGIRSGNRQIESR